MNLSEELVSDLVKVVTSNNSDKNNNTVYGTVVDSGDRLYVRLDGADTGVLTPFETTVDVKAGDRVMVSIRNHTAVVTGNVDDISASLSRLLAVIEIVDGLGIKMKDVVTFESLTEAGTTVIDGSRIKTGTIDAERLNLTDSISWDDLTLNAKSTISGVGDNGDTALSALNSLTKSNRTYLDGKKIYSGSIFTNALHLGGKLTVYKTEATDETATGGYLGYDSGFNSTTGIGIRDSTNCNQVVCTDEAARLSHSTSASASRPSQQVVCSPGGIFLDGTVNAPIAASTSDRDRKNSIENLPEKYVTMFDSLTPRRFKMNDGTSGRYHVGYIAQEVEEAMTAAGIDSQEFAGFVHGPDVNGDPIYMLRYGEFDGIYAAKIKQLEARIDELEKRLNKVEEVS